MKDGSGGFQTSGIYLRGEVTPPIAVEPRPLPYGSAYRRGAPPSRPAPHLRVVAAHLARGAADGAEVVVLALVVPLLHGQRHVQPFARDGKQVLAASPPLLVVAPHALLRVGLGEGGQLLVPPLQGRVRDPGGEDASGSGEAGEEGGRAEGRMPTILWG